MGILETVRSADVGDVDVVLAEDAGLRVPEAQAQKFSKTGTTFLCRRFDRDGARRIPFASATPLFRYMLNATARMHLCIRDFADSEESVSKPEKRPKPAFLSIS